MLQSKRKPPRRAQGRRSNSFGYSDTVFEYLPKRVIEKDSTDVDLVAGATLTSKAFLEAVNDALKKAGLYVEKE